MRPYGYCINPLIAFDLLGWISEFIYRALRAEEVDTAATYTPLDHVFSGSEPDFESQFISTSDGAKGQGMGNDWARRKQTGVVQIDVSKLDPDSIVDLTTGEGRVRHLGDASRAAAGSELVQANKWAKGKREVLIIGRVPADAIVEVKDHRSTSGCTS